MGCSVEPVDDRRNAAGMTCSFRFSSHRSMCRGVLAQDGGQISEQFASTSMRADAMSIDPVTRSRAFHLVNIWKVASDRCAPPLLFLLSLIHASFGMRLRPAVPVYSHDR
jgi:hypothetical protein